MRQWLSGVLSMLLVVAAVLAAGYWYQVADSACSAPLLYSIGSVDKRFGLSEAEVQAVITDAELLWENKTGRDLFVYTADTTEADLGIHFIYDDRQRLTVEERTLRSVLDMKENVSDAIKDKYEDLLSKYEKLQKTYEERVRVYENKLAKHNGEVAYWNNKGGAPKEVYDRLNEEEQILKKESIELNGLTDTLNKLVDSINTVGEEGNKTLQDYNDQVEEYNDRFNHEREFTEGDYHDGRINIYQFKDKDELRLVLVHELGHALSLGHVDDPKAVMYYLMDKQLAAGATITPADLAEFERVCSK